MLMQVMGVASVTTKQILVVDDEATVREVVAICLKKLGGWQVLKASSGYEGLELAQSEPVDAILLDVMMPGMDGITFLQRLRSSPETEDIPVILLTAHAYIAQSELLPTLGVNVAIAKPFEPVKLVSQVAEALGWSS
jgi:CheY-like chemotaxis protein